VKRSGRGPSRTIEINCARNSITSARPALLSLEMESKAGEPGAGSPQGRSGPFEERSELKVEVQDAGGRPLKCCSAQRARLMLQGGKAEIHQRSPFTIRLRKPVVEPGAGDPTTQTQTPTRPGRIRWTQTDDLTTIGCKVPRAIAEHLATEAKRRRTPVSQVIARALVEAFGVPPGSILPDDPAELRKRKSKE